MCQGGSQESGEATNKVVKGGVRVSGCGSVVVRKVVNATNRTWLGAPPSNRSNRGRLDKITKKRDRVEAAAGGGEGGGEREGGGYLPGLPTNGLGLGG